MIQRKQTVFLLLAFVAIVACLCLPIGHVSGEAMGASFVWYNLGFSAGNSFELSPLPFAVLVIVGALAVVDIFLFNKRRMQGRICLLCVLLCLVWYAIYAFYAAGKLSSMGDFHMDFVACLPFVAAMFMLMARRGIKADEDLIKSMDRIR